MTTSTSTATSAFGKLPCKDLLSIADLGAGDVETIFDAARALKRIAPVSARSCKASAWA